MESRRAMVVSIVCLALLLGYSCGYLYLRYQHSRVSDSGERYLSLSRQEGRHHAFHYAFFPMLWLDFKLTGQSYDFSGEDHPEYVFTK